MKRPNFLQLCCFAVFLTAAVYVTWWLRLALAVWESLAEGMRTRGATHADIDDEPEIGPSTRRVMARIRSREPLEFDGDTE